jgi:hypothetical protein
MSIIINNEAYLAEYPTDKDLSGEYIQTSINKAENLLDSLTGGKLIIC